ncbi:MAG: hypothetical protein KJ950_06980 [Proteobacteria bacterium]|nr:hypothetical protein [Pseudomonadota bacterium]MBU1686988.1 hypothetical protein [Pseudomonadota bacterium]
MRCPKCKFISFDDLATCAKCSNDLSSVIGELKGTCSETNISFFLGPVIQTPDVIDEDSFSDSQILPPLNSDHINFDDTSTGQFSPTQAMDDSMALSLDDDMAHDDDLALELGEIMPIDLTQLDTTQIMGDLDDTESIPFTRSADLEFSDHELDLGDVPTTTTSINQDDLNFDEDDTETELSDIDLDDTGLDLSELGTDALGDNDIAGDATTEISGAFAQDGTGDFDTIDIDNVELGQIELDTDLEQDLADMSLETPNLDTDVAIEDLTGDFPAVEEMDQSDDTVILRESPLNLEGPMEPAPELPDFIDEEEPAIEDLTGQFQALDEEIGNDLDLDDSLLDELAEAAELSGEYEEKVAPTAGNKSSELPDVEITEEIDDLDELVPISDEALQLPDDDAALLLGDEEIDVQDESTDTSVEPPLADLKLELENPLTEKDEDKPFLIDDTDVLMLDEDEAAPVETVEAVTEAPPADELDLQLENPLVAKDDDEPFLLDETDVLLMDVDEESDGGLVDAISAESSDAELDSDLNLDDEPLEIPGLNDIDVSDLLPPSSTQEEPASLAAPEETEDDVDLTALMDSSVDDIELAPPEDLDLDLLDDEIGAPEALLDDSMELTLPDNVVPEIELVDDDDDDGPPDLPK